MTSLPDFTNYSDEKLEDARLAIAAERERRADLATIPATAAALKAKFIDGGGDPADLP